MPPTVTDQDHRLQAYLKRGISSVDGWFTHSDAQLVAAIASAQQAAGVSGAVGEIGVHHGRMFLVMALTLRPGERSFAIDVFDQQQLNFDRSGRGDEAVFRANLAKYDIPDTQVAIFKRSSLEIAWPEIAAAVGGPARLFSVDGGHTAEIVENDIAIAADSLAEGGVIVMDDYFSREFPGVSEGITRFLIGHPGLLVPFALGDMRMFLCRPEWAARWRAVLMGCPVAGNHVRSAAMFGGEVDIYTTPRMLFDRVRRLSIVKKLRDNPAFERFKPLVRRVLTRGGRFGG